MTLIVAGIDLSLTATGVACVFDIDGELAIATTTLGAKGRRADDLSTRGTRLRKLRDEIHEACQQPALVVIEGPSFGSLGGSTHDRSGLWWLVVEPFLEADVPVAVVPPMTRAKFATGTGKAKKDDVVAAMTARFPTVGLANDNECDALALAGMGMVKLGRPLDQASATQLATVSQVAWPSSLSASPASS